MTLLLDRYLPPPPPQSRSIPLAAPYDCQAYIAVLDHQRYCYVQGLRHINRVEDDYHRLLVIALEVALKVALKASFWGLTLRAINPIQLLYRSVPSVTARRR